MILKPRLFRKPNISHPLSKGLVGCWLMNEGSGNKVYNLSGNGNDGTITTASWVTGKFGPALDFSGGGTVATGKSFSNRGITFVCWARNSTIDDGAVFGEAGAAPYQDLLFMTDRSAKITLFIGDGGSYDAIQDTIAVDFTGWHQYGVTIPEDTSENIVLYYDGKVAGTGTSSYSTTFTASLVPTGFNPFDEYLDNALFYNRALTPSEISQLYREPFCMFDYDPIELWSAATQGVTVGNAGIMTCNTGFWGAT